MVEPTKPARKGRSDRPDILPEWARVEPKVLRRLSKVSSARGALAIAGDWTAILAAAALCWHYWHPALYLITALFIGARQHDLLVLMHDAAHFRLMKKRKLNDWISELFLTWPFLVASTHGYRANHWAHHRHLNTEKDPDLTGKVGPHWTFPMRPAYLAWVVLSDAMGMAQPRIISIVRRLGPTDATPAVFRRGKLIFAVLLLAGVTLTGMWVPFLLFWVVPFLSWTPTVLRLRAVAEHYGIHEALPVGTRSRTVLPGVLGRLFFVNHPVWFHTEHHFHPSVPLYRLPELHAHFMEREEYRARVHISRGYLRALWEVTTPGWRAPETPPEGALQGYSY